LWGWVLAAINYGQIQKVADFIKKMKAGEHGMNFYSFKKDGEEVPALDMYPPLNHPQAVNFFFFVCAHMYGFWYGDHRGYVAPMYGVVNGKECKGADLVMKCCTKYLNAGGSFEPEQFAKVTPKELARIFSDDNGPILFPDFETRYQITRKYGQAFLSLKITPEQILNGPFRLAHPHFEERVPLCHVNSSQTPLNDFIGLTAEYIPGYDKDPLCKKNTLLAMALANRPEHFLKIRPDEKWPLIVDYHLMRLALRLGVVELDPLVVKATIEERVWVNEQTEGEIREAVYLAIDAIISESGKSMSFVDHLFWSGRKYCPEMTEPECRKCVFCDVCEKHTKLFQPVFRTTAY